MSGMGGNNCPFEDCRVIVYERDGCVDWEVWSGSHHPLSMRPFAINGEMAAPATIEQQSG